MYNLSRRSRGRLEGVLPVIIEIIEEGIKDSPYDFGIPQYGGVRTVEDQQELYAKGRTDFSTHQRPVTYVDGINKKSNHQAVWVEELCDEFGLAFDIYIYLHEFKSASWDVDKLTAVAMHLIKKAQKKGVDLRWGGNWKSFKDYPHLEIKM